MERLGESSTVDLFQILSVCCGCLHVGQRKSTKLSGRSVSREEKENNHNNNNGCKIIFK